MKQTSSEILAKAGCLIHGELLYTFTPNELHDYVTLLFEETWTKITKEDETTN